MSSGQENGITGTGQQFGPATKPHYGDNYAMVPYNTSSREVVDDPPAFGRKREPGQPAFLRPSGRTTYLPSLLTIYHAIPLAREALLFPSMQYHDYGSDHQWWAGTPIQAPRIVSLDDPGTRRQDIDDFVIETQRLMAFLDRTNRAYGSVDSLTEFQCWQDTRPDTQLSQFLETWISAAMNIKPDEQLTQIFTSVAVKEGGNTPPNTKEFHALEPNFRPEHETIYDTLDLAIWADQPNQEMDEIYIDHAAEVFTLRLYESEPNPARRAPTVNIEIPATWYPDRYMESCRQISHDLRARKLDLRKDLTKLSNLQTQYAIQLGPRGDSIDVRQTLLIAAEATESAIKSSLPNGIIHDDMESISPDSETVPAAEGNQCARELRDMIARIDKKLQKLDQQQQQILETVQEVSKQLTRPSSSFGEPPTNKYTLRGVSTKPHITYVLRPAVQDLIDLEGDVELEDTSDSGWQWWRISWSHEYFEQGAGQSLLGPTMGLNRALPKPHQTGAPGPTIHLDRAIVPKTQQQAMPPETSVVNAVGPYSEWLGQRQKELESGPASAAYSVVKVTEADVLLAARDESDSVMLVYANENAMNFKGSELSPELKRFADRDNRAFGLELREVPLPGQLQTTNLADDDEDGDRYDNMWRNADGQASPKRQKFDEQMSALDAGMLTPPSDPPGYDEGDGRLVEMAEKVNGGSPFKPASRVGQHADKMMERIEEHEDESMMKGG